MTIHTHRPTVAAIVGVLALAAAGPATARPFDLNANGTYVPAPSHQTSTPSPQTSTPRPAPATGSDLETSYLAIGGGTVGFVLLGAGGTVIARRRQRRTTTRSTIAA